MTYFRAARKLNVATDAKEKISQRRECNALFLDPRPASVDESSNDDQFKPRSLDHEPSGSFPNSRPSLQRVSKLLTLCSQPSLPTPGIHHSR